MGIKFEAKCIGLNELGYGMFHVKNKTEAVPNFLPKEVAIIEQSEYNGYKNYRLHKVLKPAKERVDPKCSVYHKCGSCQLLHMDYDSQIEFKKNYVLNCFKEYKIPFKINEIIRAEQKVAYRNKMQIGYRVRDNQVIYGFYEEDTHRVVAIDKCNVHSAKQNEVAAMIAKVMKELRIMPYNEDKKTGVIRYALIREAIMTKQLLVTIVTGSEVFPGKNEFIKRLLAKCPYINTIIQNINGRKTSIVLGDREKVLYGSGSIEEILCGIKFKLSSQTFFQVNPVQTEKLYNKVAEYANFKGNEIIIDAYCGVGTIGMTLAKHVKHVYGVESNKKSVANARQNAIDNKIKNISFVCEDATNYIMELAKEKCQIDAIIMDPPRSGSTEAFLNAVKELKPQKVVYVSCEAKTLARDLKLLEKDYIITSSAIVDLFVGTYHIETIVSLIKK